MPHDLIEAGGVRSDEEGVNAMMAFELQMIRAMDEFHEELPRAEATPAGALNKLHPGEGRKSLLC